MLHKFRSTLVAIIISAATLPVLVLAYPMLRKVTQVVENSALRELGLVAENVANDLNQELRFLTAKGLSICHDSDIQRATKSILFVSRAEELFGRFQRENPWVESIYLLDDKRKLSAAVPVKARAIGFAAIEERAAALFKNGIPSEAGYDRWEEGTGSPADYLLGWFPVPGMIGRSGGVLVFTVPIQGLRGYVSERVRGAMKVVLAREQDSETSEKPDLVSARTAFIIKNEFQGPLLKYWVKVSEPRAIRFALVYDTIRAFIILFVFILFVLAGCGYLFAHVVNRPLLTLSSKVLSIENQLQTLRQQMQPHFLFNILNNIATIVPEAPQKAVSMISRLSELYRAILESSKSATAPLEEEIKIVTNYLELQKMRFGERIKYSMSITNFGTNFGRAVYVPCLLLQTLVENAVKHGISKARDGGSISIEIQEPENGLFCCRVLNSGAKLNEKSETIGHGTGLENTRKRLNLLYGEKSNFHMGSLEDGRTEVSFYFTGKKIE